MVGEDPVPTLVQIQLALMSALVVLGTAWAVIDVAAMVSFIMAYF